MPGGGCLSVERLPQRHVAGGKAAHQGADAVLHLDAGLISRFDGNHRMLEKARAAGRAFEVQGVLDDWLHILRPRHRMEELVRRLKSHGYCVYYLSNIPQDVLDLLRDRGVLDGFDGGVASCEVHINKPDPKIYKALLDKYSLKAEECVFIDDRLENVQAACRKLGADLAAW